MCRALHGAFAFDNPTNYCAHVALDPTQDSKGSVKNSDRIAIDSLFLSQGDKDFYERNANIFGFDPDIGLRESGMQ